MKRRQTKGEALTTAFWDTSALVPLCVGQAASGTVRSLVATYGVVVWWATAVEMRSAFQRLVRMRLLAAEDRTYAERGLEMLRRGWREIQPSEVLRTQAEALLQQHSLRAADALQLAAAVTWAAGDVGGQVFISGDEQLLAAATKVGLRVVGV